MVRGLRYLFGKEEKFEGYSHLAVGLPWIRYIQDLNPQYFDTVLLDLGFQFQPAPPEPRLVNEAGQSLRRVALGHLLGFKNTSDMYEGPLRHNDPDLEQQLRALIETLSMPDQYYRLLEFIRKHPEDYPDISEQEREV